MPLNEAAMSKLMYITYAATTLCGKDSKKEFDIISEGIVKGLKEGSAIVITQGSKAEIGFAGQGTWLLGALNPGPVIMAPLIQAGMMGSLPSPTCLPTPIQLIYYLAISQSMTHVLTSLSLETTRDPIFDVAIGIGTVFPGGFSIPGASIENYIIQGYKTKGMDVTDMKKKMAKAIGKAVEQTMKLATIPAIPIIGGIPVPPPVGPIPMIGKRTGIIT